MDKEAFDRGCARSLRRCIVLLAAVDIGLVLLAIWLMR